MKRSFYALLAVFDHFYSGRNGLPERPGASRWNQRAAGKSPLSPTGPPPGLAGFPGWLLKKKASTKKLV